MLRRDPQCTPTRARWKLCAAHRAHQHPVHAGAGRVGNHDARGGAGRCAQPGRGVQHQGARRDVCWGCKARCTPGALHTQGTVHVARQPCGVSQEASRAQEPSAEEVQALRAEVELLHQTLQDVTQVPPALPCTPPLLPPPPCLSFPSRGGATAGHCPRPSQAVLADDPGSPTEAPRLPCRSLSPAAAAATLGAVHGALRRRHFQLQVSEEEEEEEDGCGGRRMGGWMCGG